MRWEKRYRSWDLRSGGSHLAEQTGAGTLLRSSLGRSLLGLVSGGRVRRLLLVLRSSGRAGWGRGRAGRSAARGGGSGTALLARHFDGWFVVWGREERQIYEYFKAELRVEKESKQLDAESRIMRVLIGSGVSHVDRG